MNITRKGSAKYKDFHKRNAVRIYLKTGNMSLTSRLSNIPYQTLYIWSQEDWWSIYEDEVRREKTSKRTARIDKLVDKVFEVIEDRIDNGDTVVTSKGVLIKKPIDMRTATTFMTQALERQEALEKEVEQPPQLAQEKILDRLASIADKLAEAAKIPKSNIIDVTPENVNDAETV